MPNYIYDAINNFRKRRRVNTIPEDDIQKPPSKQPISKPSDEDVSNQVDEYSKKLFKQQQDLNDQIDKISQNQQQQDLNDKMTKMYQNQIQNQQPQSDLDEAITNMYKKQIAKQGLPKKPRKKQAM
jgi:hypothetical protein